MPQLELQLEIIRGQIEELRGRLEELIAQRQSAGPLGSLPGRSRRVSGQARQVYARARSRMIGIRTKISLPPLPGSRPAGARSTKYALIALGLVVIAAALALPRLLSRDRNPAAPSPVGEWGDGI